MNKTLLQLLASLFWCVVLLMPDQLYAQSEMPVKGTVRTADNGTLMPGVTILANGKLVGMTDQNGAFSSRSMKREPPFLSL